MTRVLEIAKRVRLEAHAARILLRSGTLPLGSPRFIAGARDQIGRYGIAGALEGLAALRHGDDVALIDEVGPLTYRQLDERSNAVANALRASGIGHDDGVAILCRNHRGFLDATFGVLKVGGRALFLNTEFSEPQAREVCAREGVQAVIYDQEFTDVVAGVEAERGRWIAWSDDGAVPGTLDHVIAEHPKVSPPKPAGSGRTVILTSGTTGTPKGASREQPRSLVGAAALFSRIPFGPGGATFVAPPMFHAFGLGGAIGAITLGSTLVLRRRPTPDEVLDAIEEHRCDDLVVVPVILRRLLDARNAETEPRDLSCLRIIFTSGSQLEADLATRAMDAFGDVVYNLYGSTEVAYASIATPEDLRAAPGCVGKPPLGTSIRLLDDQDRPMGRGETGRIFVSNGMEFGGYTDGSNKAIVDGHMSTGDVGHFDRAGRLFIDGRDDEMIISGGENVFPRELEELLVAREDVVEVAAVGVPDEDFGQRLSVFVVLADGCSLSEDEVRSYVRDNLARYKVPRDVRFLDALPRNPTGKVLKRELVKLA